MDPSPQPEWFDPKGLAEWLGIPLRTVYEWNHRGTGPKYAQLGRHCRYRRADVEAWLAQRYAA